MKSVRFEARKQKWGKEYGMCRLYSQQEFDTIPIELLLAPFHEEGFHWAYRTKLEYKFDEPGGYDGFWLPWQEMK